MRVQTLILAGVLDLLEPRLAGWEHVQMDRREPIASPVRIPPFRAIRNLIVAVCVLLSAASAGCSTTFGHQSPRNVQVPDVTGQVSADAIATLVNLGFRTRMQQKPDSSVPPDHVIDSDPKANTSLGAGAEVTLDVSTGPEQRPVPDVSNLSYADAVNRLTAAGFGKFKQRPTPSTPEQKDRVVGTIPPANATSPITAEITILVGSGP
jgi:beta-lactam-binding protein with PASTA domain